MPQPDPATSLPSLPADQRPSRRAVIALAGALVIAATIAAAWIIGNVASSSTPAPIPPALVPPADPVEWLDVVWERVDDPGAGFSGPLMQDISIVVAGGPGYVAAGTTSIGVPGSESSRPTIWISETGERWLPIPLDAGVGPGNTASITALAAGPQGIVAWGNVCCQDETAAIWWSADGGTWERVSLPPGPQRDVSAWRIVAGPDGFVAIGNTGAGSAAWTSPDGRSWVSIDRRAAGFDRAVLTAVARDDQGWLIVGYSEDGPTHDGLIWRSDDRGSWRVVTGGPPLAGPDEVELYEIQPFAGGYLLLGNVGTHEDRLRCEQLLGMGPGPMAAAGGETALSCGWGAPARWWSKDGGRWQELPPNLPRAGGRGLLALGPIRAGGPGIVTIGYEDVQGAEGGLYSLWATAEGRTWRPVGGAPQFPLESSVADVVVSGRRLIAVGAAVGQEPGQPAGVIGQDGAVWTGTVLP